MTENNFVESQDGPRPWIFASRTGQISYQATASFRSNDGEQLRAAVLAGLGITQALYWLFAADIRAGLVFCKISSPHVAPLRRRPDFASMLRVRSGARRTVI
jgi:DNA-binding transcriptional LysR family regulator